MPAGLSCVLGSGGEDNGRPQGGSEEGSENEKAQSIGQEGSEDATVKSSGQEGDLDQETKGGGMESSSYPKAEEGTERVRASVCRNGCSPASARDTAGHSERGNSVMIRDCRGSANHGVLVFMSGGDPLPSMGESICTAGDPNADEAYEEGDDHNDVISRALPCLRWRHGMA